MHFSLRNDDLVIRVKQDATSDPAIFQLVPPEKLAGDLPAVLIDGHVHWLNVSTSVLEVRPQEKLWETSPENWTIDCALGRYRMRKGCEFLIDLRSKSWAMVSGLLKPLDSPENLLVTCSPTDSELSSSSPQLSVSLLRYGLSFYVDKDGDLQSHNIRNMVYDEDQSIGTMFGLVNRLVLRPKSTSVNAHDLVSRCVLIPEGDISFQMDGHHVLVGVDTRGSSRMTYQTYKVDTDLGCLTGNVSLTNKLYCAYLHALTSGCSIDPLTGRSGTEEAMSLLRSANCWSIMKFSSRDAELLGLIASMCPSRTWYPEQLTCMQKVEWLDLPASTQHHELYVVANGIKEHCEKLRLFHESQPSPLFESFPSRNGDLLKRGALRAAYLYPSELSAQLPGENSDVWYPGRDIVDSSLGEQRACTAAATVHYRTTNAAAAKYVKGMMKSWGEGTVAGSAPLSLQYDRSWLNPDLLSIWLEAYDLLRDDEEGKWIQLFFSLPAMAYASPDLSDVVPVFVAFAAEPHFDLEDPPIYDSYHLAEGYRPSPDVLCSYVLSSAYSFDESPESTEPARPGESSTNLQQRQLNMYGNRLESNADAAIQQLLLTWPCETPSQCSLNPDLYNVAELTPKIRDHFASCYRNLQLKQHLTRVQKILKGVCSEVAPVPSARYSFLPSQTVTPRVSWLPTVGQLFVRSPPSLRAPDKLPRYTSKTRTTATPHSGPLRQLISVVEADATDIFQFKYVSALRDSAGSLESGKSSVGHGATKKPTTERLRTHYAQCRNRYVQALEHVRGTLGPGANSERAIKQSGQWPRITPHTLFRILASNSSIVLSDDWKKCLTKLALIVLELQRARRLLRLHLDDHQEEFLRESENEGCDGWAAEQHPDWLLVQVRSPYNRRRRRLISYASSISAPRQLLDSSRPGRRCERDDITMLRKEYSNAAQHG